MDIAALATWITAAAGGLYLLAIWLIEYDKEFQATAATRLPPLVLACHVLFAFGGLIVWVGYLIFDVDSLAWVAVVAVLTAAALGTTMAIRWLGVYREARTLRQAADGASAARQLALSGSAVGDVRYSLGDSARTSQPGRTTSRSALVDVGPPERNFPLPVVIGHGVFAATTIALVVLTALGVGGS